MTFKHEKGKFYRMPAHFGPTPGPRQWPSDQGGFDALVTERTTARYNFLTNAEQLEAFLPPGFELWGDPIATLDITWQKNIPWLAGRGYNLSDFKFMAKYNGKEGPVHGTFVLVRWESLTDPIISGRDELGHNKIYCKIAPWLTFKGKSFSNLSWEGHTFANLEMWDLKEATPPKADPLNKGQLGYKYIPKTGCPGEADVAYTTLSPLETPQDEPRKLIRYMEGQGSFQYHHTTWEQFPFSHHLVSAIAALENKGFVSAQLFEFRGGAMYPSINTHIVEAAA